MLMETESVKSGFSSQSLSLKPHTRQLSGPISRKHQVNSYNTQNRSLSRSRRNYESIMSPYQTAVTLEDGNGGHEVIEVQILPQDENWGENTTAITGNTSEHSGSIEEMALWPGPENNSGVVAFCSRHVTSMVVTILSSVAFFSPIIMLVLPKMGFYPAVMSNINDQQKAVLLACRTECKSMMITISAKLILLVIGTWAVFLRRPRATMPRIFLFRAVALLLVLICCVAFWLFYFVQAVEGARGLVAGEDNLDYRNVVSYVNSFIEVLLIVHYVALILLEIRHLQPQFYIKVIRSPDGESRSYAIGQLSIQRAAVWILEHYYTEFNIYNPYLQQLPVSKSNKSTTSYKFYDVDGYASTTLPGQFKSPLHCRSKKRDSIHNERFYEEHDYERRVKKRRARLITAAEDAFTHVKRINHEQVGGVPMDSTEAAQAVFPSLARSLQKYLRVTRQQPRHTMESILHHLSICLSHDLSPHTFLEPFLVTGPVLQHEKEQKTIQNWSLICSELLSRPLKDGVYFQLRQNDVSLFCTVYRLPHLNISEEIIHPKSNRFALRMNSETSV